MMRFLCLMLLAIPMLVRGQVVTYAKTLPERAFSVGLTPAYHSDRNVVYFDAGGASVALNAGYGILYSLDVNARYIYFLNGTDYMGVDVQYLFYESRESYFSAIAGLHKWDEFGFDLTGLYTYAPRYYLNLSVGLDMDLSFASEVNPRFWLPLNVGFNVDEAMFIYAEYDLPVSERSWGIVALGLNYVFR